MQTPTITSTVSDESTSQSCDKESPSQSLSSAQSADCNELEFDGQTVLCRVCGDRASGFHYGVHACEGCKGFFRRSIQQKIHYRPCLKNQMCLITRVNRNRCQYCRLKKCIAVGMSRDAVRFGRVPKREKAKILEQMQRVNVQYHGSALDSIIADECRLRSQIVDVHMRMCPFTAEKFRAFYEHVWSNPVFARCSANEACPLNPAPEVTSEADVSGLAATTHRWNQFSDCFMPAIRCVVDFARCIPGFQLLSHDDQVTLLKAGTFEVLLVHLSCLFDARSSTMLFTNGRIFRRTSLSPNTGAGFLLNSMFDFAERFNELRLTDDEMALFSALIIISSDRPGLRGIDLVEKLQAAISRCLQSCMSISHPNDPSVFAKLLIKISDLRTLNTIHSEKLLGMVSDDCGNVGEMNRVLHGYKLDVDQTNTGLTPNGDDVQRRDFKTEVMDSPADGFGNQEPNENNARFTGPNNAHGREESRTARANASSCRRKFVGGGKFKPEENDQMMTRNFPESCVDSVSSACPSSKWSPNNNNPDTDFTSLGNPNCDGQENRRNVDDEEQQCSPTETSSTVGFPGGKSVAGHRMVPRDWQRELVLATPFGTFHRAPLSLWSTGGGAVTHGITTVSVADGKAFPESNGDMEEEDRQPGSRNSPSPATEDAGKRKAADGCGVLRKMMRQWPKHVLSSSRHGSPQESGLQISTPGTDNSVCEPRSLSERCTSGSEAGDEVHSPSNASDASSARSSFRVTPVPVRTLTSTENASESVSISSGRPHMITTDEELNPENTAKYASRKPDACHPIRPWKKNSPSSRNVSSEMPRSVSSELTQLSATEPRSSTGNGILHDEMVSSLKHRLMQRTGCVNPVTIRGDENSEKLVLSLPDRSAVGPLPLSALPTGSTSYILGAMAAEGLPPTFAAAAAAYRSAQPPPLVYNYNPATAAYIYNQIAAVQHLQVLRQHQQRLLLEAAVNGHIATSIRPPHLLGAASQPMHSPQADSMRSSARDPSPSPSSSSGDTEHSGGVPSQNNSSP